jgi:hypothetical protein
MSTSGTRIKHTDKNMDNPVKIGGSQQTYSPVETYASLAWITKASSLAWLLNLQVPTNK